MKNICYNPTWIIATEHPAERIVRNVLLGALALCACAYLYTVGGTVLNLMERKEAAFSSTRLAQSVAQLEAEYLDLSQALSVNEAHVLELEPVESSSYVYRPGSTALATPRVR